MKSRLSVTINRSSTVSSSKITVAAIWEMDYKTIRLDHRNHLGCHFSIPHEDSNGDSGDGKNWAGSREY